MFSKASLLKEGKYLKISFFSLIILFLSIGISIPMVSADNLTINYDIKNSCRSNEVSVFSIFSLQNSHIAQPNYYENQICISGKNITSSSVRPFCNTTQSAVLRKIGFNNTHAGTPSSTYPNIICVQCPINSTIRNPCNENETAILSFSDNSTNSHVAQPNYYPYKLCVIKTNPDVSEGACNCTVGKDFWNLGGELDPTKCCEDDPGEYKRFKECVPETCNSNPEDDACCNPNTDCVNNSVCYAISETADTNSDLLNETCESEVWGCNDSDINDSCISLGYPNGYCINELGNCAPKYSMEPKPDKYYMPNEEVRITGKFDDKENDTLKVNITILFPNGTIAVNRSSMDCSDGFCEYIFQSTTLGDYDVKFFTQAGAKYTTDWYRDFFSINTLNLTMNFENQRSGGGKTQDVYGKVWREPYHTLEENANITIDLEDKKYAKCDTTNIQGEYSCKINEPTYPREYEVTVSGTGHGVITGNITDYLKIISPEKVQVSMNLNFSLGTEKDDVYVGEEQRNPGLYSKSEIEKHYLCAEDSNEFSENTFVSLIPTENIRSVSYYNTSSHYSFGAEERRLQNRFLITFSKGECSDVLNTYEQIKSDDFYKIFSPSVAYPSKKRYKVYLILNYPSIDIRNRKRLNEGSWQLFIENNGTHKGNPQVNFNLIE